MAVLDSLLVQLAVDSAALRSGLKEAQGALANFGSALSHIDEKLTAFGEMKGVEIGKEVLEKLGEFVMHGAEAAEQMGKLAQATGMPVEAFSQLAYAAGAAGVGQDELAKSLEKMDKNLAAAGAGGKEQQAIFSSLGVAVKDAAGNVRPTSAVLGDLADKFSGMKDGASKTALAMEVFGKSGADMIPMLNEGREGIQSLAGEADRLGLTLSGQAAASAKGFEENINKLKLAFQGVAINAASQLTPALKSITDSLLNSKDGASALKETATILAGVFKVLASAVVVVLDPLRRIGTELAGNAAAMVAFISGDFEGAKEILQDMDADIAKIGAQTKAQLKALWSDSPSKGGEEEARKEQVNADKIAAAITTKKQALVDYATARKSIEKQISELSKQETETAGGGGTLGAIEAFEERLQTGDLSKLLAKLGKDADEARDKLRDLFGKIQDNKIAEIHAKVDFDISKSNQATGNTLKEKQDALAGAGETALQHLQRMSDGFLTAGTALQEFQKQSAEAARLKGEGELKEATFGKGSGSKDLLAADAATKLANKALEAAGALTELQAKVRENARAHAEGQFNLGLQNKGTDHDVGKRARDFANVGASDHAIFGQLTAGFDNFEQALQAYSDATKKKAADEAALADAERSGDEGAQHAAKERIQADEFAAEQAGVAADAFKSAAEKSVSTVGNIIKMVTGTLTSNLGKLGTAINAGIQGFQSGGVWGAIIAVVMEFLTQVKGWGDIVSIGNGQFAAALKDMASGLGSVINGLKPLMGAIGLIAHAIHGVLNPILEVIGNILQGIAPIFAILGMVLEPLGGMFKSIFNVLGQSLKPVLVVLTYIFIGIGEVMMGLQIAVSAVWLALVTAGDEILKAFGNHSLDDARDQANQAMKDNIAQAAALAQQTPDSLMNLANASADAAEAAGSTATNLNKLNAALTNVPEGFKIAAARFNASQTQDAGGAYLGSAGGSTTNINIGGSVVVQQQLMDMMAKHQKASQFVRYGTKYP